LGLEQAAHALASALSRRHWNKSWAEASRLSEPVKERLAAVSLVGSAGPAMTALSGSARSIVHA
jgi:hypothetical protein